MPERWDEFKVSSTERQVVRALGSIGSATLVSRVVGFVRDIVVALVFGAGPVTDAFFVAFRIPNILRRLLAEGALSTAMIPVFSEYFVTQSRPEVLRMLRAVLALALVALGVTALLGIATAPWRSEEHTSELQSQSNLVCRLLLEKKKKNESREPGRRPPSRLLLWPRASKSVG